MKIYTTTLIFLTILFSFNSYEANASRCIPLKDRVIAQCKDSICNEIIFIRDVISFSRCRRMPEIIELPKWAKSVVEYELNANNFSIDEGIYELVIFKKVHRPNKNFRKVNEYIEIIESNDTSNRAIKNLREFRQFEKLSESSFDSVYQQWKSKEREQYKEFILFKIADWSILIVSFVLLMFSMLWFSQWINRTKKMRWLALSLIIQLLIMYFTVWTLPNPSTYMIVFLGILIPVIWAFEIILFVYNKTKSDKSLID